MFSVMPKIIWNYQRPIFSEEYPLLFNNSLKSKKFSFLKYIMKREISLTSVSMRTKNLLKQLM